MKKLFYAIAAFISLGFVTACCDVDVVRNGEPLEGMWQYCQPIVSADGDVSYTHRPIYKVIDSRGAYYVCVGRMTAVENAENNMQEVRTFLTQKGRYEIESDSVYYEYIELHNHKPFENTTSVMNYKFDDENKEYMHVTFVNNETGISVSEVWRRVEFVGAAE